MAVSILFLFAAAVWGAVIWSRRRVTIVKWPKGHRNATTKRR